MYLSEATTAEAALERLLPLSNINHQSNKDLHHYELYLCEATPTITTLERLLPLHRKTNTHAIQDNIRDKESTRGRTSFRRELHIPSVAMFFLRSLQLSVTVEGKSSSSPLVRSKIFNPTIAMLFLRSRHLSLHDVAVSVGRRVIPLHHLPDPKYSPKI